MAQRKKARKPQRRKIVKRKAKPSPEVAIVRVEPPREKPWLLNTEEITLVKNSIAKGASDEELKFCLTVARRYRLDPFKQQIWFVSRWDKNADNGKGGKGALVFTPQVGINGLLFAAARDHREEFGSVSKPEYGPLLDGHPQWASVKVTKKNGSVTEAEAWWEEYAPSDLTKAPFWRKMPRRMLGKCATALAIREAYPDLGGLYIPEECEKIAEDYTAGGRRIIDAGEPQRAARLDDNAPHGHEPGSEKAKMAEEALRRVEEADKALASGEAPKAPAAKPHGAKQATFKPDPAKTEAQTGIPAANRSKPVRELPKDAPLVEIEWTDKGDAIVRGDIGELLEDFQKNFAMAWIKEWWHVVGEDVKKLTELCVARGYRVQELLSEKTAVPEKTEPAQEPPVLLTGVIEASTEKMTKGSKGRASVPYLSVLIKSNGKSQWYSTFRKTFFEALSKGKGKSITFGAEKSGNFWNLVEVKRVGSVAFEEGLPVIEKNREAGGATLFGG